MADIAEEIKALRTTIAQCKARIALLLGNRPPRTWQERFWSHVHPEPNSGCWLWDGPPAGRGYGRFNGGKRKRELAHRVAWELTNGPIPPGMVLDHRVCKFKLCVNPDHMVVCTNRENLLQPDGMPGRHARKTHCLRGHEFTAENVRNVTNKKGHVMRFCRKCHALRERGYYAERRKQERKS